MSYSGLPHSTASLPGAIYRNLVPAAIKQDNNICFIELFTGITWDNASKVLSLAEKVNLTSTILMHVVLILINNIKSCLGNWEYLPWFFLEC